MAKTKELGLDKQGIQKTMRLGDYLADGMGMAGPNMMMALAGQISYFYTEKAGVAAGVVSAVLLISKIADAFTDLIMGKLVDSGRSPKGKCRPWFLRMALPSLIAIVLLFSLPQGLGTTAQLAYMIFTNILLTAVVYTAIMVPYSAIINLRTKSIEERSKIQVTRNIFAYAFGAIATLTVIPVTNLLGGTQSAWIKYGVAVGLFCMVALLILYKHSKEVTGLETEETLQAEKEQEAKEKEVSFAQGIKMLFSNRVWVLTLIFGTVNALSFGMSQSSNTYYSKYIYGNDNLVAVAGAIGMVGMLIGFVIASPLIKKFGLTKTVIIATIVQTVPTIIRAFIPYAFWANVCLTGIAQTVAVASTAACGVMTNNCVEFNEKYYGYKLLGITNSANGFATKVGNGLGTALITFILAITGYKASLAQQPQSVTYGIFAFTIYIPIVLAVIKLIFVKMYQPYEAEYYKIMAEKQAQQQTEN